jgi:DNA-binding NarL/FixJ family response regulator
MKQKINIIVADDHTVVREGLCRMLELESCFNIIGEAKNGRQAVNLAIKLEPDMILMDIAMAGLNGIESTRQINEINPKIKIVILTAYNDIEYINRAYKAGASGFLLKQESAHHICKTLISIYECKTLSEKSAFFKMDHIYHYNNIDHRLTGNQTKKLTSREIEVLQLIAEGKANKETAYDLSISIKTVEKHRCNLMMKLGIHDTASLTRYAISAGITECSVQQTF